MMPWVICSYIGEFISRKLSVLHLIKCLQSTKLTDNILLMQYASQKPFQVCAGANTSKERASASVCVWVWVRDRVSVREGGERGREKLYKPLCSKSLLELLWPHHIAAAPALLSISLSFLFSSVPSSVSVCVLLFVCFHSGLCYYCCCYGFLFFFLLSLMLLFFIVFMFMCLFVFETQCYVGFGRVIVLLKQKSLLPLALQKQILFWVSLQILKLFEQ
jgi:hypothetical protein